MDFIVDIGALQVLLLTVMFLSVMVEIKTGGMGIGVLLGIVAAGVFWGSQYTRGLVELYHIAVFLAGVLMIIVEILLPTVGLLAGLGVAAMLYSIVLALGGDIGALAALGIALIISVAAFMLIVSRLPSSKLWNKMVLRTSSREEAGYVSAAQQSELVGKTGEVLTELRPAGTARIDGRPVDVISEGAYIQKGKQIVVLSVNGSRVVVREAARPLRGPGLHAGHPIHEFHQLIITAPHVLAQLLAVHVEIIEEPPEVRLARAPLRGSLNALKHLHQRLIEARILRRPGPHILKELAGQNEEALLIHQLLAQLLGLLIRHLGIGKAGRHVAMDVLHQVLRDVAVEQHPQDVLLEIPAIHAATQVVSNLPYRAVQLSPL